MKSKCRNADYRYPVTPDPEGKGRVICTSCQSYCDLHPKFNEKVDVYRFAWEKKAKEWGEAFDDSIIELLFEG